MNNLVKFLTSCVIFGVSSTVIALIFIGVSQQVLVTWASYERQKEIRSYALYDNGKKLADEFHSEREIYLRENDEFALHRIDDLYLDQFRYKQKIRQKYLDMMKWHRENGYVSSIKESDYYDFSTVIAEIENRKLSK